MHLQSLILSSALLVGPLLGVVSAYPRPVGPNLASIRPNLAGNRPGNRPKPKDGPGILEPADNTGSDGTSSGEPESDIFHGPDGDAPSACPNRLPETLLFSVEKGHDCIRLANKYNDQNTDAKFNCRPPAAQRNKLCAKTPNFGALAENCYEYLKQNYPVDEAEAVRAYVGLCR